MIDPRLSLSFVEKPNTNNGNDNDMQIKFQSNADSAFFYRYIDNSSSSRRYVLVLVCLCSLSLFARFCCSVRTHILTLNTYFTPHHSNTPQHTHTCDARYVRHHHPLTFMMIIQIFTGGFFLRAWRSIPSIFGVRRHQEESGGMCMLSALPFFVLFFYLTPTQTLDHHHEE
jgi:hypothetical protein